MSKELVVYFSVYGTAKIVAEEIAKQTGADIAEIEPVVPYDSNRDHYNALARLAKKEHDEDRRPAIKNEIDIDSYDRIYIGYPMWSIIHPMMKVIPVEWDHTMPVGILYSPEPSEVVRRFLAAAQEVRDGIQ